MALIDFILNLAGLLLWLNWRSLKFDPLLSASAASLAGTLRRAAPRRVKPWHFLAALAALLLFRAVLYWQIGSEVNWTPNLHLGAIAVSFRSDFFGRTLLFSLCSFAVALAVFYLWLLLLSLVNGRAADVDPWQRLGRLHLGQVDRWAWPIKLILPLLIVTMLWLALSPLFARLEIIPPALSAKHRLEQALVIGFGAYLPWKYLIGSFLALYLLSNYVFLGSEPFWNFVGLTGRNLLIPLRRIPLRLGKADFAPVVGIALVFLAAGFAEHGLTLLYGRLPL